ncbi:MAG: hexitol phosphatase HxpB [Firmicutes bacterium]|nr:hexitol phosphatase HxpB [Bacillota bacterium]
MSGINYLPVELVIFDMDGVIIDSEPFWQRVERQVFYDLGFNVTSLISGGQTKGMRLDQVIGNWQKILGFDSNISTVIESAVVKGVIDCIKNEGEMIYYARQAIDFFLAADIPLALASGSNYQIIDAVMDKFSLRDKFSLIYSAEDEMYGKPHPGIFMTTATLCETLPISCVVIEDSLNGVIAAKAASMRVIALPPEEEQDDIRFSLADRKLCSLDEIKDEAVLKILGLSK